jgi:hypothetical protein
MMMMMIPETNNVPREHIVAAILLLLFKVPISLVLVLALLYFYVSTFRSTCGVPNVAVFCITLTSWCPEMLLIMLLLLSSSLLLLLLLHRSYIQTHFLSVLEYTNIDLTKSVILIL